MHALAAPAARSAALDAVLDVAALATGTPPSSLRDFARTLIAAPEDVAEALGGRSGLNRDGSPLQVCFSVGHEGLHCRLLVDPACELGDPVRRYQIAREGMHIAAEHSQAGGMREICERTLDFNLPANRENLSDYPDGVLWVGAGVNTPGLAMYVDARRGGPQAAWPRLKEWFAAILPSRADSDAAVDAIAAKARIMCLGVEGISPRYARAKVYWRIAAALPLGQFGIDRFSDPRFVRFLSIVMRNRDIQLDGVVASVGFHIATGELSDVKLDVCACRRCLHWSAAEWRAIVNTLSTELGLAPIPIDEWLTKSAMSFIGFAIDHRDAARYNIYLKQRTA